jgi:hypothetical protein
MVRIHGPSDRLPGFMNSAPTLRRLFLPHELTFGPLTPLAPGLTRVLMPSLTVDAVLGYRP